MMYLKMMKVHLLRVLIFAIPSVVFSQTSRVWLEDITLDARTSMPMTEIPNSDFFEVPASKELAAEAVLKDSPVIPKNNQDIKYYGQLNFSCEAPKTLYLVRAIYSNGGNGAFSIHRYGLNLLVIHNSLGSSSEEKHSALVVCLDFHPTSVFGEISSAR